MWMCDLVWCHKVTELKAGILARRFRSSVFCGRGELLLVWTSSLLTAKILYINKNIYNTLRGKNKFKMHNMSPLISHVSLHPALPSIQSFSYIWVDDKFGRCEASLQTQIESLLVMLLENFVCHCLWVWDRPNFAAVIVKQRVCTVETVMSLCDITEP